MHDIRKAWLAVAAVGALACDDKSDDSAGPDDSASTGCQDGTIALQDANNYLYDGTVDVPAYETAVADVEICWDQMTTDIQCHDVDPVADIDNLTLIRFGTLGQTDVEAGLSGNNLQQADISGYVQVETEEATCAMLSDMSFFGTPIDIEDEYVEGGSTYMLTLNTGLVPGVGARNLLFLEPTASSDVTHIDVEDGCGILEFDADLESLDTLSICETGSWTMDWSDLTRDGHGGSLDGIDIDVAMLGFYEGKSTADLQASFLDLELDATQMWQAELDGGSTVELATLSDGSSTFSGFSGTGAWMFALRCSRCSNPAPVFLTILEPSAE